MKIIPASNNSLLEPPHEGKRTNTVTLCHSHMRDVGALCDIATGRDAKLPTVSLKSEASKRSIELNFLTLWIVTDKPVTQIIVT